MFGNEQAKKTFMCEDAYRFELISGVSSFPIIPFSQTFTKLTETNDRAIDVEKDLG